MLFCKGRDCHYKHTCSRYVLGKSIAKCQLTKHVQQAINDQWIDHCINAKKFDKHDGAGQSNQYIPIHGNQTSLQND